MAVGTVQHDHVHLGIHKRSYPVQDISRNAYTCTTQKPSLAVFGGKWIFNRLLDVLNSDQPRQIVVVVYDRQLLFPRLGQNLLRLIKRNADFRCDQTL